MGLLDGFLSAAAEANENAHGVRLYKDMQATINLVNNAHADVERKAWNVFHELHNEVLANCKNWSREGTIKVAKELFAKARASKDFDIGTSYGYALAGCLTESMARTSAEAKQVLTTLGRMGVQLDQLLNEQPTRLQNSAPSTFDRNVAARVAAQSAAEDAAHFAAQAGRVRELSEKALAALLAGVIRPATVENRVWAFIPTIEKWCESDQRLLMCAIYGVTDGVAQHLGADDDTAMSAFGAILINELLVDSDHVIELAREGAQAASSPGSLGHQCLVLGGRAGKAFARNPSSHDDIVDLGYKLKQLIDSNPLW